MTVKISHDTGAPAASIELMITRPLPDYDLDEVEAPVPRDVDPMLASQGFKDLLDEARATLEGEMAGSGLVIAQLTGAICRDGAIHRPGIWLVVHEAGGRKEMSAGARERVAGIAEKLRRTLGLA